MWVPIGFAHGFVVLADDTEFLYKTTDYWAPEHERSIRWNDASLGIDWPVDGLELRLSEKDQHGVAFVDAECFP
jgi:dTDP-4-dehydrorhamnose 3,5-epimerase